MSDREKDSFKQINLAKLENFDEERVIIEKDLDPDWDKFTAFYNDLKSKQRESNGFRDLFDLKQERDNREQPVFKQFGEEKNEENNIDSDITDNIENKKLEPVSGQVKEEIEVESESDFEDVNKIKDHDDAGSDKIIPDQEDYDKGYDQGFELGKKDGYEKGFKQGEKNGQEKGSEQGYSEGYEKGRKDAQEDIKVKIAEKAEDFKAILNKLENTYHELAHRYEEKIISLICKIAEKVVLAKVEIDEEIVKESVLDALKTLPEPEDIILSVSDEDYEYIEMVKEDLFDSIKSLKSVSVKSDTSVKRGGCRIETEQGYVESDIETKLNNIFLSIKGEQ